MHIDECEDSAPRSRFVKDPIHDLIEISPRLSSFLDTRQFQRLRNIKQLGTTYYVWIGACHNRFEHCIGVAHLSRLLASHIKTSQPELNVTDRDVECVAIAGLCHDLGHGPWSHVFDGMFIPKTMPHVEEKDRWTHEKGSEMMFDYLVQENNISIYEHDKNFIKALIAGEPDRTPSEKSFLFDIVANKRNGLDVDKFDYIARDSQMAGHAVNINTSRILQSARVLHGQICYDIKDVNNIYEVCATRFRLHKMLYNHKTAKAIEYMIIDVLLSADKYLGISDSLDKPEKYLRLTDSILETIEASEVEELEEARQLVRRIRTRDLYRRVDYKVLPYDMRNFAREKITPQRILDAVRERFSCHGEGAGSQVDANGLGLDDIIVDFSTMHYGMKEKNPLDKVMFYSKSRPNQCYPAQDGDYSFLRPSVFAEVMLQVFTKNPDFYGVVQAGYRAVVASLGPEPFRSTASTAQQGRTGSPDVSEGPPTPRDSPMATPTGSVTDILQSYASLPSIPSTTPGGSCLSSLLRENEFTKVDASYRHISPVKQLVKPRSTSGGPGGSVGSGGKVFPTSGNSGSVIEMQSLGEKRPRDYTGFMEEPGSPSPKRRKAVNGAKG